MSTNTMSVPELAERLRISTRSAYRLIAKRLIETTDAGTGSTPRTRVTEQALDAYLQRRASAAKAA